MPRPCKKRRVCAEPSCLRFGPWGSPLPQAAASEAAGPPGQCKESAAPEAGTVGQCTEPAVPVIMTLDEYESLRLIDYEGLTQEQCAAQMDVARTTVQAIYSSARQKLARCLVESRPLDIGGGDFVLCGKRGGCRRSYCGCGAGNIIEKGEDITMRIGVTYENGQVFQHFGHTEQFKLYDVQDGKIVKTTVVDTNGSGHGALAGFLQANEVDTLICGGIGGGAQNALAAAGIRLFGGVTGDADAAVDALLKDELVYSAEATCSHHDHDGHHGNCGGHGHGDHHGSCGEHGCHS